MSHPRWIRRKDRRYTVRLEYCGYVQPRHVARFCGEWIGCGKTKAEAKALVEAHHLGLMGSVR